MLRYLNGLYQIAELPNIILKVRTTQWTMMSRAYSDTICLFAL